MEYRGFELENIATDFTKSGREYLCYWKDELAGGADDWKGITKLIDQMIEQGVTHESLLKEVQNAN
jgi:hypothetical protein